jgi:membrane protease YdiL (CAAX protease family)
MESRKKFKFIDHPWITFWALLILIIISILLSAIFINELTQLPPNDPFSQLARSLVGHLLMVFLFIPFILRLPKGKRTFKEYLNDIRLTNVRPFLRLILIAISCFVILILCQSLGVFVFRLTEGKAITGEFIRNAFNITRELPPQSWSLLFSFPSIFEEIVFRGALITFFLLKYSKLKAIIFSSFGFSIIHLLNLLSGGDPVWTIGQTIWAFILGLFYGYLFVQTGSLLPNMLFHYLSNVFVGAFNYYIQSTASTEIQVLYGVTFTLGILPVFLMILWTKFFTAKLPFRSRFTETEMKMVSNKTGAFI